MQDQSTEEETDKLQTTAERKRPEGKREDHEVRNKKNRIEVREKTGAKVPVFSFDFNIMLLRLS